MDVWNETWPLRRNKRIDTEYITFCVLWERAEGRPARIVVTAKDIQKHFARDGSSIRSHFEKLARIDVVRLIARNRRGEFLIDVMNPCPAHAEAVPDPQMLLPGMWTDAVEEFDPGLLTDAKKPAGEHDKPGGDAAGATRGEFPATHVGIPKVGGEFPVTAGSSPRGIPRVDSAEKSFSANSSAKQAANERGEFPASDSARGLHHYNDNDRSNKTLSKGPTNSKDNDSNDIVFPAAGNSPRETPRGKLPAVDGADELEAYIEGRRRAADAAESRAAKENTLGETLLDLFSKPIDTRYSTAARKQQVILKLKGLVGDRNTSEWLFGAAADLLVVHGASTRPDAGEIYDAMNTLLQNMAAFREMEDRNGKPRKPLGKWLNKEFHKICDAHGIKTSKRRAMAMAGAQ